MPGIHRYTKVYRLALHPLSTALERRLGDKDNGLLRNALHPSKALQRNGWFAQQVYFNILGHILFVRRLSSKWLLEVKKEHNRRLNSLPSRGFIRPFKEEIDPSVPLQSDRRG